MPVPQLGKRHSSQVSLDDSITDAASSAGDVVCMYLGPAYQEACFSIAGGGTSKHLSSTSVKICSMSMARLLPYGMQNAHSMNCTGSTPWAPADQAGGGGGWVRQHSMETWPRLSAGQAEVEIPWWTYGPQGMQMWFPSSLAEPLSPSTRGAMSNISTDPELEFDREVYPIGISIAEVAIIGKQLSYCAHPSRP